MANGHGGARPGAGRKRSPLPKKLVDDAVALVEKLIEKGDKDAIKLVLDRAYPVMRPIKVPEKSASGLSNTLRVSDKFLKSATFSQLGDVTLLAMRTIYVASSNALRETERECLKPESTRHPAWLVMTYDGTNYCVTCVAGDYGFVIDESFSTERNALDFFMSIDDRTY